MLGLSTQTQQNIVSECYQICVAAILRIWGNVGDGCILEIPRNPMAHSGEYTLKVPFATLPDCQLALFPPKPHPPRLCFPTLCLRDEKG